ncbi:MAG: dihydropteroate synthase [Actinobacteria bacterium]|nr:dihydropteroate synthase [Actinomycetota bacterium]
MGVLNVTPDSFFDGDSHPDSISAARHADELVAGGAAIVDVGGESTRPGAAPVDADTEVHRVEPVIQMIRRAHPKVKISVDTMKLAVAEAAVRAGASYVNDVSAFEQEPEMAGFVADAKVDCCLMHMQGEPRTMQADPKYVNVVDDVRAYLESRMEFAIAEGVPEERIQLDPGIGFGKNLRHNLALIDGLDKIVALGRPVVIGVSRKSFIGRIAESVGVSGAEAEDRLPGTIAANVIALQRGARVFRVHDAAEAAQSLAVAAAIDAAFNATGHTL